MLESPYGRAYYEATNAGSEAAARLILGFLLKRLPPIESAVDVGCGTGVWLSILQQHGIQTIRGYDGHWVLDSGALRLPGDCFQAVDLNQEVTIDRRFDLAICVEVAEHLDPKASATLVHTLCQLSDVVLFAAAVPGQGGVNHVNERWPSFWFNLFRGEDYQLVDLLRPMIWDHSGIPFWYRQNVLLYFNGSTRADLVESLRRDSRPPLCIVHPELYCRTCVEAPAPPTGSRSGFAHRAGRLEPLPTAS
jgi:hypothetical protein